MAKRFGSLQVLEGIDLKAGGGELLGLIGPNGAGKTTLMRCIADGAERSAGEIELCGRTIRREGPAFCVRAGLGRKFQNANIFDSMTVAESLRIASAIRERPSWLRRAPELRLPPYALEVLRMTELDQCLDRPARDLSHGQQQALELAMVLALEPRVVLLDEPTAGLSKAERTRIGSAVFAVAALRAVLPAGRATWISWPRWPRASSVLHQGRIVMDGSSRMWWSRRWCAPSTPAARRRWQRRRGNEHAGEWTGEGGRTRRRGGQGGQPALALEGVSSGYKSALVLRDVSLAVEPGPAWRCWAERHGQEHAAQDGDGLSAQGRRPGAAGRRGRHACGQDVARHGVAYAAQEQALFPDLSIRDNLRLGLPSDRLFDERFADGRSCFRCSPAGCASMPAPCRAASRRCCWWRAG